MKHRYKETESVRPGRGQPGFLLTLAYYAAPLNVMAGWWETQLQGAPGWLALRGDIIVGCTRLIDWPCCPVARDSGCEASSCTAATASCSPLLLPLLFISLFFPPIFTSFYLVSYFIPDFVLFSPFFSLFVSFSTFFSVVFLLSLLFGLSLCGWLLQACCRLLGLLHYFLSKNAAGCLLKTGETLNVWVFSC